MVRGLYIQIMPRLLQIKAHSKHQPVQVSASTRRCQMLRYSRPYYMQCSLRKGGEDLREPSLQTHMTGRCRTEGAVISCLFT